MKLFSCVFFSCLVSETTLKDFPFYSAILLTLWFRYLETCIKEMYLSSQLPAVCRPKFQKLSLKCLPWGHPYRATELSKQ